MHYYENVDHVIHFLIGLSDFLIGLSDSLSQVRSQIMLLRPIPDINQVFALVLQ